jgi:hypothetical protein
MPGAMHTIENSAAAEQVNLHGHSHFSSEAAFNSTLRKYAAIAVFVGVGVLAVMFIVFITVHLFWKTSASDSWLLQIINAQFPGMIAVPLSALASLCVVLALKASAGPIEFEAVGFKFSGASGPLAFWVVIFIEFIWAVHYLWK